MTTSAEEVAREWMAHSFPGAKLFDNRVQSLARLITAERNAEREECATICDEYATLYAYHIGDVGVQSDRLAAAIRAKKEG